jgi:hypothetical protein
MRRTMRSERGQTLVLGVILMVVLLGIGALTTDLGLAYWHKSKLQSAADAAALAGVQVLPDDPQRARDLAAQWAAQNSIGGSDGLEVTVTSGLATNDTISVRVRRDSPAFLSRVLGFLNFDVRSKAVARVGSPTGLRYFVPFAVLESSLVGLQTGDPATIKYNQQDQSKGNSLLLDVPTSTSCGGGADALYCNIVYGSQEAYCAYGQEYPGCSSTVPTKTGQNFGKVSQALSDLITLTSAECDEFGEVFVPSPESASDMMLTNRCNPYPPYYASDSKRVIIIPVIESLPSGSSEPVTILRFALFFVTSLTCQQGKGSCDLKGIYVQNVSNFYGYEEVGAYFPTAPFVIRRLIE